MLSGLLAAARKTADRVQVFERRELQHYFHYLDIIGTIGGCLKLTREWRVKSTDLAELGEATRIYYNLRDLEEDMLASLFNIPSEDMLLFGITLPDHTSKDAVHAWCASGPVQKWCANEAKRGLALLAKYREKRSLLPLHSFTRAILHHMYERKTHYYLLHVPQAT